MRSIGWVMVVLLAASWVAAELPPMVASKPVVDQNLWRRTSNGWERADWLLPEPATPPLWLHPGSLVVLQVSVSVIGLRLAGQTQGGRPLQRRS